jgi:hypothetical protein
MQNANQALGSAIASFASQPGVTPDQVDQLRNALVADQGLLASVNTAATAGTLRGFALEAAQPQRMPTGLYDKGTGIVTVPNSSFTSTGTTPSPDLHSVLHVQAMVVEFAYKSYIDANKLQAPVSSDMVANLQDTLNGSPALAAEIKRAATMADPTDAKHRILESFDFVKPGSGVGGSFKSESHTMNLPAESLRSRAPGSRVGGYDPYELTFVIGHEVQHGFNSLGAAKGRVDFIADAQFIAASRSPVHDYTQAIEKYVQSGRDDEARAEISGWNALQSRVVQEKPDMSLRDMHRVASGRADDFLVNPTRLLSVPRPNIQLNGDLTMSPTTTNVAAMGQNYFDRPTQAHMAPDDDRQSMALGPNKDGDYANYYASWAISTASWAEQNAPTTHGPKPQIMLNMAHAHLYEDMIERSGLDIGQGKPPVPYLDSSRLPATQHHFDHTLDGPNTNTYVPVSLSSTLAGDSRLHSELRDALPAETSHDRIAQIALAAKEGGIEAGHIRTMDIVGTNLMLTGETAGTRALVDLSLPPLPAEVSNHQFNTIITQQGAQVQHMNQQQATAVLSHHL